MNLSNLEHQNRRLDQNKCNVEHYARSIFLSLATAWATASVEISSRLLLNISFGDLNRLFRVAK